MNKRRSIENLVSARESNTKTKRRSSNCKMGENKHRLQKCSK